MKIAIRLTIIFVICMFATAVFSEDKNASLINEKFKIIEGHQKNLDESYQNKLKDLDVKFKNRSKMLDVKINAIDSQRKNMETTLASEYFAINTRVKQTESILNLFIRFFGPVSLAAIIAICISIYKIYKMIPELAETKAKEKFDHHFAKEFEKRFQAKWDDIKELIEQQNEELQLRKHKKIVVLNKQDADDQFITTYLSEMGFENATFETFDPQRQYTDWDLTLFNDQDKAHSFGEEEIIAYANMMPATTICFYFGAKRIPPSKVGDNFTFANIKMQLYGNLMNALRFQEVLQ